MQYVQDLEANESDEDFNIFDKQAGGYDDP